MLNFLIIIFLPGISFILAAFFGRFFGKQGTIFLTTFLMFLAVCFSVYIFKIIGWKSGNCYITLSPWLYSDVFILEWCFLFDSLTIFMLLVVNSVSLLVHIYSSNYMFFDANLPKFMSYLSLFTFFMLILVTSNNFLQLFLGWEGVGLCSYLLISFWFTRLQANKSAIKAMVLNRIGDLGLFLGICLIFFICRTLDFGIVFASIPFLEKKIIFYGFKVFGLLQLVGCCFFFGCVGKSAQIGLHTWLPAAMEGPTPVSALIHAATMVTAGVFLLIRCSFIFEHIPGILIKLCYFGAITAFFASIIGMLQNDIKRIIAYSTCAQLGYMVFICGLSNYSVSLYHLSNHAFFKALLFLGAGSIIHSMSDEQDIRRFGALNILLPFSYACILIGSLALMGFPFLSGFYSKDLYIYN